MSAGDNENVRLIFLGDQVGLLPPHRHPDIAVSLLGFGFDSEALRKLAARSPKEPREAKTLWAQVRTDLGKPYEDDNVARRVLGKNWLSLIARETHTPRSGVWVWSSAKAGWHWGSPRS